MLKGYDILNLKLLWSMWVSSYFGDSVYSLGAWLEGLVTCRYRGSLSAMLKFTRRVHVSLVHGSFHNHLLCLVKQVKVVKMSVCIIPSIFCGYF